MIHDLEPSFFRGIRVSGASSFSLQVSTIPIRPYINPVLMTTSMLLFI